MNALRWFSLCAAVLALTLTTGVDCIKSRKRIKAKKEETEGSLRTVSVGRAGVWGVNKKGEVYYREETYNDPTNIGSDWDKINSGIDFKQVDVGLNIVWGVAQNDRIYYRTGIDTEKPMGDDWERVQGQLMHVTVSPSGYVWGVNSGNDIYYRKDARNFSPVGDDWFRVKGALVQISAGYSGVWGVNKNNQVYYLEDSFGDVPPPSKIDWMKVEGSMVYISSGDGYVSAIDDKGHMYIRMGVTSTNPEGINWKRVITAKMLALDSYRQTIWAVDMDDKVSKNDLSL